MQLSARNQFEGHVTDVRLGAVMAEVHIDIGGHTMVSAITRDSAERLALAVGDRVVAIIKSTEVLVGK
jgi:molybdopterin-binding protein